MNPNATRFYARFRQVLTYIDSHLEEDLSLETLSEVAAFSKYHFHRQFSQLFGISLYRYIQLQRLKRASYRLAFRRPRSGASHCGFPGMPPTNNCMN